MKFEPENYIAKNDNTYVAPTRFARNVEKKQSTSEMEYVPPSKTIRNGKIEFTKPNYKYNPGAGYISNADPIAEFVIGDAILGKPLQYLAKTGLNKILGKTSGRDFAREINSNISSKSSSDLSKAISDDAIRRETTNAGTSMYIQNKDVKMPEYFKNKVYYDKNGIMTHANPKSRERIVLKNGNRVNTTTSILREGSNSGKVYISSNGNPDLYLGKNVRVEPKNSFVHVDDEIIGKKFNPNKAHIKDGNLVGGYSDEITRGNERVWWEMNKPFTSGKRTLVTDGNSGGNMIGSIDATGFGNSTSYINKSTPIKNIKGYEHNPITNYHSKVLYTDQLKNNLYKNIPFDKKPKGAYNVFKNGGLIKLFNK